MKKKLNRRQRKLLENLKKTKWYLDTPFYVKQLIEEYPPVRLYRRKTDKVQFFIFGYTEDKELMVQYTGINSGFLSSVLYTILKEKEDIIPARLAEVYPLE